MPGFRGDPVLIQRYELFDELGQVFASERLSYATLAMFAYASMPQRTGKASLAADLFILSMFLSGLNRRTVPLVASR